ncbi:hypothetical protein EXU85_20330 [Spirosoma sp. KCTC 42546]|uniref:hypothetical protein n=1 Tax=Spirosoma sp. KCTC 42546 TaxID=2520506 RepID=UPI001158C810|nr:hypothetical protein [Spirosoma sp. KCTC 42546]QDK80827.1 hypothetical protein EXU85_20330 [Spirosoma sp. KCTC 42546]
MAINTIVDEVKKNAPKGLSEEEYCKWLSDYLNSKLNKHNYCREYIEENTKKSATAISFLIDLSNKLANELENNGQHWMALLKIRSNRFKFINYNKGEFLYFDFSYLANIYNEINYLHESIYKILKEIDRYNIIYILDDINYIVSIESEIELQKKNKLKLLSYKLINIRKSISKNIKSLIYRPKIILLIIAFVVPVIIYFNPFHIIVKADSQQTITLSLLGAITSFLGFLVVFLQISYENQKKLYGQYVKKLLFNETWQDLILIFTITAGCCLLSSLLKDDDFFHVGDIAFNVAILGFILFFIFLIPGTKKILNNSFSITELKRLVNRIDLEAVQQHVQTVSRANFFESALNIYEHNPIAILNDIIKNSLINKEYRIVNLLINEITNRYEFLLDGIKNKSFFDESLTWKTHTYKETIESFIEFSHFVYNNCLKESSDNYASMIVSSQRSLVVKMAILGVKMEEIRPLLNTIREFVETFANQSKYKLTIDGLDEYYYCLYEIINHNTPKEEDLSYSEGSRKLIYDDKNYDNYNAELEWHIIREAIVRNYEDLIKYCIERLPSNDKNLTIKIIEIYKRSLNFILPEKSNLDERRIFELLHSYCAFVSELYKELLNSISNNEKIWSEPFFSFEVIDLLKKNKNYSFIMANYWLWWMEFKINEKKLKLIFFDEIKEFIFSILRENISIEVTSEYLIACINLYNLIFENYKNDTFKPYSNIIESSLNQLESIENKLNENPDIYNKVILAVNNAKTLYEPQKVKSMKAVKKPKNN